MQEFFFTALCAVVYNHQETNTLYQNKGERLLCESGFFNKFFHWIWVVDSRHITICACVLTLLCLPSTAMCHGTCGEKIIGGRGIHAFYSDGSPMSYCKTRIFIDGEKLPFQAGATDRNGRFMIWTEAGHSYKFVVSDGMGHRYETMIEGPFPAIKGKDDIEGKGKKGKKVFTVGEDRCTPFKAAAGVSIILFVGCIAWIRFKKI